MLNPEFLGHFRVSELPNASQVDSSAMRPMPLELRLASGIVLHVLSFLISTPSNA